MAEIRNKGNDKTTKEAGVYDMLLIVNEMMARGFEFLPIDIYKSDAVRYKVEDGKIRLPLCAANGVGAAAAEYVAKAAAEGDFMSIEELQEKSGATRAIIDALRAANAMGDLPESNQISLF